MNYAKALLAISAAVQLGACSTYGSIPTERVGSATLAFGNGLPAGTVQLLSDGETVTMGVAATGLEPGAHGFHLHTTGKCESPGFQSAGGHLNPAGREHGSENPSGKHLGDLPNLVANDAGRATAQYDLPGSASSILEDIFDADGTAVVIHAGPDDYRSDPAGDAGSRVACGVIKAAG